MVIPQAPSTLSFTPTSIRSPREFSACSNFIRILCHSFGSQCCIISPVPFGSAYREIPLCWANHPMSLWRRLPRPSSILAALSSTMTLRSRLALLRNNFSGRRRQLSCASHRRHEVSLRCALDVESTRQGHSGPCLVSARVQGTMCRA